MKLGNILRHSYLIRALAAGLAVFGLLSLVLPVGEAAMLGWCAHVAAYAGLLLSYLGEAEPETMRERARLLAEGRAMVLSLSLLTATASLLIVVLQLAGKDQGMAERIISIVTIIFSWFYVQLLFAQDYAHEYWAKGSGIDFPGGDGTPEFSEFVYFAFVVGCTFQVSDSTTSTPRMRKLVLLHSLTAFWFNAVILASAVNTIASLGK